MTEKALQTYANHTKLVPLFHYVALPILLINFVWSVSQLFTGFSFGALLAVLVAFALILIAFFARVFALGAQDRVIRLEEHLRMQAALPDDLQSRVHDFTIDQICALRFASDDELPGLARKVLEENIPDRKTIKQMIQSWKADYQRL